MASTVMDTARRVSVRSTDPGEPAATPSVSAIADGETEVRRPAVRNRLGADVPGREGSSSTPIRSPRRDRRCDGSGADRGAPLQSGPARLATAVPLDATRELTRLGPFVQAVNGLAQAFEEPGSFFAVLAASAMYSGSCWTRP